MVIVHLTASRFFGGPERQMLGLAQALVPTYRSAFLSFAEGGKCMAFLDEAHRQGFEARKLVNDTPHGLAAVREIGHWLRRWRSGVLCCHGYKADLLGRWAARREKAPVIAVARGWTGENWKVRVYEALDRWRLRGMDRVVCVSGGQAARVRRIGLPEEKVLVIHNAIDTHRFTNPDPPYEEKLRWFFPRTCRRIVGAAGRLSPEKGFATLIDAAREISRNDPSIGFILFGDGPLRAKLARRIEGAGLAKTFVLAGFRDDFDSFLPFLDLLALPSFTEGLPNVVLEAFAAGVPVVATAVGGTPELVDDGVNGYLISPGDAQALARRILDVLSFPANQRAMGQEGREKVAREFTFEIQARQYRQLFEELIGPEFGCPGNLKSEYRNPKQIQMSKKGNPKPGIVKF
jgi:glycosyltransferase involved in cell wall biosynthesis